MKLYHFTSLENLDKILETKTIQPMSPYDGKMIIWLTKEKEKRYQYWAIGEHKDKTQIRLQVSTVNFIKLVLPTDQTQDFVRLGAVDLQRGTGGINWYISECSLLVHFVEIFRNDLGRYVYCRTWRDEESRLNEIKSLKDTKWYTRRWNKYYSEKYGIDLGNSLP